MYELFFGFTEKPFSLFPDHRFLFLNRRYKLALSLLEFGVLNKNGMILLTGDPGMGKTTLLQKILADIDETVVVGHLTFTHDKNDSLLSWVLHAYGLEPTTERSTDSFQLLEKFFLRTSRQGQGVLLVVDEAQNLAVEKLEELRLLFNLNDREGPVFQVLLAGHSQIRERLKDPQLAAFVQRIGTDFSLEPLNEEDTMAYIRHRLLIVGGSASLFSDKACDIVYHCTRGVPRLINQLCETSLIYGFSEQATRITETLVIDAAKDRQQSGLFLVPQEATFLQAPNGQEEQGKQGVAREAVASASHESRPKKKREEKYKPKSQDFKKSLPIRTPKPRSAPAPVQLVTNPERYWKEGFKLRDDGWCLEAIQSFKRAATHGRYHMSAWFQVGQCYVVLRKNSEALNAFRTALTNPHGSAYEQAEIQYAMGQVLEDMGKMEESQRCYRLASSTDPGFEPRPNHGVSSPHKESQWSSLLKLFRRVYPWARHNRTI